MGIEVQLGRESAEIIAEVGDPEMILSRAAHRAFSGPRLLRYLTPCGDAVFNQAQAPDPADDIRIVRSCCIGNPLCEIVSAVEPLVEKLSHETQWHKYADYAASPTQPLKLGF
jgi:hypothetical protein